MNNENLIELQVVGVTRNQLQTGAYALVLEEVGGSRRVPVVVGMAEAQSIAVRLEGIIPPRPLTHDLMTSTFHAFGIELERIVINGFQKGVFASELWLRTDTLSTRLDSRTSDAIALALRTGARIYTTSEVMARTSYDSHRDEEEDDDQRLEDLSTERLKECLEHHVEQEEYEKAAEIQKIIKARSNH